MDKTLINKAKEKYHYDASNTWVLGIICGLFCAAFVFLNFFISGIGILIIPLLVLPFFFACYLSHLDLLKDKTLTFKSHWRNFFLFFVPPFNSSFRFWKSFFKSLLVFIIAMTAISFIYQFFISDADFEYIYNTFYNLQDALYDTEVEFSEEYLANILKENNYLLANYLLIAFDIPFLVAVLAFIYFISKSSISIYFKLHFKSSNPMLLKMTINDIIRKNRKTYFKNYLTLNWPLFVLLAIGFTLGLIISRQYYYNPLTCLTFAIVAGLALTIFFMPFYFPNMEVLYDTMEEEFKAESEKARNKILHTILDNEFLSSEDRENLKNTLFGNNSDNVIDNDEVINDGSNDDEE